MKTIITTDLKNITLSSGLLLVKSSKGDIVVDIKQMMKEPIDSDNAYFNATRVASYFSRGKELNKFMNLKSTKEYIQVLNEEFNDYTEKGVIKKKPRTHFVKRGRETEDNKGTFGTYLHTELFFEYLGWLDVRFRREIHKLFKSIVIQSNVLKIERENTKILFKGLTDTIKDVWIPAQDSDNGKKYAYSTLATLSNIAVLGCMSKKYATDNEIEIEKGKSVRDYLSEDVLKKIEKVEENINGFIKYGNITDYEELKAKILKD